MMIKSMLIVFIGGGFGSIARYYLSLMLNPESKSAFAIGTFLINIFSCLLAGIIAGLITKNINDERLKLLLLTGFCGGFSTFSTYILESYHLVTSGQLILFLTYIIGSIVGGLICCVLGVYISQYWI
jgi:fluoride exporter